MTNTYKLSIYIHQLNVRVAPMDWICTADFAHDSSAIFLTGTHCLDLFFSIYMATHVSQAWADALVFQDMLCWLVIRVQHSNVVFVIIKLLSGRTLTRQDKTATLRVSSHPECTSWGAAAPHGAHPPLHAPHPQLTPCPSFPTPPPRECAECGYLHQSKTKSNQ